MKLKNKAPEGWIKDEDCFGRDNLFLASSRELCQLADKLGLRHDWHEPDEQEVKVKLVNPQYVPRDRRPLDDDGRPIFGHNLVSTRVSRFDNANSDRSESHIEIYKGDKLVGRVNLANLLAWASNRTNQENKR